MTSRLPLARAFGLQMGLVVAASLAACGGGTAPRNSAAAAETDWTKTLTQGLGCVGGAALGAVAAKALAASDAKRLRLSAAEATKRERGYLLAFALGGCGAGSSLAGTAYAKLSDAGKKAREQELLAAAASAQPRTYRDPANPQLVGTATPQPAYQDPERGRECRDVIDNLSDAGKGEPVVVKYCRNVAGGGWAPVTA